MARLRKAGKIWREATRAAHVMVACPATYFTIQPEMLFVRAAPLEIELGAGRGDFVIARAAAMPEVNFLAVELAAGFAQLIAARAVRAGITNLRVVRMDARPLVNLFLPAHCVSAYHIYFPDPWPKARHAKHRLFTPSFLSNVSRTLRPGARLYVATDMAEYAEAIFAMAEAYGFRATEQQLPGVTQTAFGRKFVAADRPIYSAAFIR